LLIIFLFLILLPLALLLGLGLRLARYEQRDLQRRFQDLYLQQLSDIDFLLSDFLEKRQRELQNLTDINTPDPDFLRQTAHRSTFIRQMFYLGAAGNILYPAPQSPLNKAEAEFLQRFKDILVNKTLLYQTEMDVLYAGNIAQQRQQSLDLDLSDDLAEEVQPQSLKETALSSSSSQSTQNRWSTSRSDRKEVSQQFFQQLNEPLTSRASQRSARQAAPQVETSLLQNKTEGEVLQESFFASQIHRPQSDPCQPASQGWFVWYWGRGIQLVFWRRGADGHIVGAELDQSRLLSDIIALLPGTDPTQTRTLPGRITLTNALGRSIYQWGSYEPPATEKPFVERSVTYPLSAWRLKYFLPSEQLITGKAKSLYIGLIAGLFALGLTLLGLAVYFYRESTREIRQASQRVTFVNQVSHELKTPLTNIRMYAELMESDLLEEDKKSKRHLAIIVSESQRLSRLIANILSFSRKQRNKLILRRRPGIVDECIRSVLDNFRASLENHSIKVEFISGADQRVNFDPDVVEQILGNLLNNVEKYAASGGSVKIESRLEDSSTVIIVSDRGPGVPARRREKIFTAFYRVSNKLTDGVSGTGIGLAIARDLARLHGGDLILLPSTQGAVFELRLATPPAESGDTL